MTAAKISKFPEVEQFPQFHLAMMSIQQSIHPTKFDTYR